MQEYVSDFIFEKTNYHLAESNLLSFGLEITNEPNYWTYDNIILAANYLCSTFEKIKTDDVKNLIIQTRDISKFPTNISEEEINFLIEEQKKYYRNSLFNFLKKVELNQLISILTKLVNEATDNGQYTCKWALLEDLIFDYEISFKTIFQKRDSDIKNYIQYIIDNILPLKLPDNSLNDSFYELEKKIDVWNEAVQPIKILKKSRGIDDDYFYSIFECVRNLGIKASNDYDYFIFSYRLTKLLSVKFSEIRKIYEIIKNDEFNLENLINLKTEQKN